MKFRNFLSSSLFIIGLASASIGIASTTTSMGSPLKIINNTDFDSTSIINDGRCSNSLPGGYGVTKAHKSKEIPAAIIGLACIGHATDCKADIYLTDNCTGPKIASAILDTTKGITGVTNISQDYVLSYSGFVIQADPK